MDIDISDLNLFIVGAPRCGTTALYRYLQTHPDIFLPQRKEPHYFGADLRGRYPYLLRDRHEYLGLFSDWRGERRLGEGSTWYLYSECAAADIGRHCPEAKIIIMLRNPFEVMRSLHANSVYTGNETILSFDKALAAEAGRKNGTDRIDGAHIEQSLYYREAVRFSTQVERYLRVFGRARTLILLYDDFKADVAGCHARVCRFLSLPVIAPPSFAVINERRQIRSHRVQHALRHPAGRHLARALPRNTREKWRCRLEAWNSRARAPSPQAAPVSADIARDLHIEIARLSSLLDRNLSHWSDIAESAADGP